MLLKDNTKHTAALPRLVTSSSAASSTELNISRNFSSSAWAEILMFLATRKWVGSRGKEPLFFSASSSPEDHEPALRPLIPTFVYWKRLVSIQGRLMATFLTSKENTRLVLSLVMASFLCAVCTPPDSLYEKRPPK